MSEQLGIGDFVQDQVGELFRIEELSGDRVKVHWFPGSHNDKLDVWVTREDIERVSRIVARAVKPPDIMTRIEEAAARYLAETARAPQVVILGAKEWDELANHLQDVLCRDPSSGWVTVPIRFVRTSVAECRVVRDAERDSCLEVYG